MKEVKYKWRVKWVGRWVTTRYYATEAAIRIEHPEAVRLDHTRIEQDLTEVIIRPSPRMPGFNPEDYAEPAPGDEDACSK